MAMFTVFIVVPVSVSLSELHVLGHHQRAAEMDRTDELPQMFHDPAVWQASETTLKYIAFGVIPR